MRRWPLALLAACSAPAAPVAQAPAAKTPVAQAPAAKAPVAPVAPVAKAPAPDCPALDAADAKSLAVEIDAAHEIDLDGDPRTIERLVKDCFSGLRCTYRVYAQRAGCWTELGAIRDLMGAPHCTAVRPDGGYCTLSGMRLMIHGDAQEYVFAFVGSYGPEYAGTRYVPGPSKFR